MLRLLRPFGFLVLPAAPARTARPSSAGGLARRSSSRRVAGSGRAAPAPFPVPAAEDVELVPLVSLRPSADLLAGVAGAGLLLGLFVHNFWAATDLWLMARVADQLYAGNGLVWNPGERTWVYTSVLWQWLLVGARGVSGGSVEPYLHVLVLHGLCLLAALGLA